jgi:hypothetical protein
MIIVIATGFFAVSAAQNDRLRVAIALALVFILTPAALAPIRSYDFFWHLATGRWIAEHQALPLTDPFTVASDRTPWINGEWLFEVMLYAIGGLRAAAILRAIFVALIFAAGFYFAARDSDVSTAALLTAIAFAGAWSRLDLRPSTFAAGLLMLAIACATRKTRAADIAFIAVTILWINVHPSALIAPLIALLLRPILTLPAAIGLLMNPFGWRAIVAPLKLTAFAQSGAFVNAEWLPSPPTIFPLLYLCVILGVSAFAVSRKAIPRFILFVILAYLAIAHVRNQGLFFATFPLLIAPMRQVPRVIGASVAAIIIAGALLLGDHSMTIAPHRFPVRAVARLKETGLPGNIYNPDQFGGYLIWTFYPQRRALTDGRNELYHQFIVEYARARTDSRAWRALLQKYRIDLAVDEYRGPIETVDAATKQRRTLPASLAYWPRNEWALIGHDDVAMVFARRAAFAREAIDRWELKGVVPDGSR